jgi:NAD(P) transhydrogenase subunit beta
VLTTINMFGGFAVTRRMLRDVPQVRLRSMTWETETHPCLQFATVAYIGATILFILSLGGLSNPETSRRGNLYGIIGMTIAVLATVFGPRVTAGRHPLDRRRHGRRRQHRPLRRARVQMTQMPELVALMHSLVGLAACLVGFASYIDTSIDRHGRREGHPRSRDLRRHPDRRGDLLRLGDRLRQALRQDRRQAAAAAGAPLAQPAGLLVVIWFGREFLHGRRRRPA